MKAHSSTIAAAVCTLLTAGNFCAFAQDTNTTETSTTTEVKVMGPSVHDVTVEVSTGYDVWHGFPDGTFPENSGAHVGANVATLLVPQIGLGAQVGGSYGVYDWNGRDSAASQSHQEQTFFTTGVFVRGPEKSPVSAGVVYDMMINHNFGGAALDATLQQLREQVSFKICHSDEVGIWAAEELNRAAVIPITYRGIDQGSLFYNHRFEQGANLRAWLGMPLSHTLSANHNVVGTWLAGGRVDVPLNDHVALYAEGAYLSPRTSIGFPLKVNEVSSVSIGLTFSFGGGERNSRSSAYLPVADNSTFFVDGSTTF